MTYEEKIDARSDYDMKVIANDPYYSDNECDIVNGDCDEAISLRIKSLLEDKVKMWQRTVNDTGTKGQVVPYLLGKLRTYNQLLSMLEGEEIK